jgi:hypothetical protein
MQAAKKQPHLVHSEPQKHEKHAEKHYYYLAAMIGAHFVVMYALMYLMVDGFQDVFLNANNFYMSGAMAAPMAILMLIFMRSMYPDAKLNAVVYAVSAALLVAFIWFTRQQSFIGNEQFIKSMIPHHSGAILMCDKAALTDTELKALCAKIASTQREEIDQMKAILGRIERSQVAIE